MDKLKVKLQSVDDKVMFSATARENPPVIVDYFPPVGTGGGYTSLELVMAGFGSCVATTLLTVLRYRMQKKVAGIDVEMDGLIREEHPKSLKNMKVMLSIKSTDVNETEINDSLKVAEEMLCPVWAMIKGNVDVDIEFVITE